MRKHTGFYGRRQISISTLYSDNEKGIQGLTTDLSTAGITAITCGPGMHVHVVERAIRYVKEGVRGVFHGLPFTCPRILFKMLVPYVTLRLNLFASTTRTDHLSAFRVVYGRAAIADKDCNLHFGGRPDPTPTTWTRALR